MFIYNNIYDTAGIVEKKRKKDLRHVTQGQWQTKLIENRYI